MKLGLTDRRVRKINFLHPSLWFEDERIPHESLR